MPFRVKIMSLYNLCVFKSEICRSLLNVLHILLFMTVGTAVAQWLRDCATNRKVSGSIPDGVIGVFH